MNWSSLYYPLPLWLHNRYLSTIGISVYNPLTDKPQRIDPKLLPAMWQATIGKQLDAFATQLGKPICITEIGYRNSAYALYRPWQRDAQAQAEPPDPAVQAAAYDAALAYAISDRNITGIYFWSWSDPLFEPNWKPAAKILYKWYTSPKA